MLVTKNILCEGNAVKEVLQSLENIESYKWININYINNGRYAIVEGGNLCNNIAITFKKEWFLKYGEFANRYNWRDSEDRLESGIGDTLNISDLQKFIQNKVKTIYVMHQKGAIYKISLLDFLLYSFKWTNKESKEVRSISIHKYKRVNP